MPKILVMMSTYNGEKYVEEQIDSILAQTTDGLELLVRDDGSTDRTAEILEGYAKAGKLTWYQGKNAGPGGSFFDLMQRAGDAEYYAFSDQDDYWQPEKLAAAVERMEAEDFDGPLLYFGRKNIVDQDLKPLSRPDFPIRSLSFGTAMLNSYASGCTMVYNKALKELLDAYQPAKANMHDAWVYRVASALGRVIYDENAYIEYRQHGNNVVGMQSKGSHWKERFHSIKRRSQDMVRIHYAEEMLEGYGGQLSEKDKKLARQMAGIKKSFGCRLGFFFNPYATTQRRMDIVFVKLFALLGWL